MAHLADQITEIVTFYPKVTLNFWKLPKVYMYLRKFRTKVYLTFRFMLISKNLVICKRDVQNVVITYSHNFWTVKQDLTKKIGEEEKKYIRNRKNCYKSCNLIDVSNMFSLSYRCILVMFCAYFFWCSRNAEYEEFRVE